MTDRHEVMELLLRAESVLQDGIGMRIAQVAYFKDRSADHLLAAKNAERAFDVRAAKLLGLVKAYLHRQESQP